MKRISLLAKISLQYWRHHRKRFFTLMISLVTGVAALSSAALLIRSEKEAVLERELCLLGDYDVIAVDITPEQSEKISGLEQIKEYGTYLELGYAGTDNLVQTKVAAFPDGKSEEIYHMTCLRGEYPQKEDEVALDLTTAKTLGVRPYPGEKVELGLFSMEKEELERKEFTVSGIYELSNQSVYGGWYRYPGMMDPGEYDMPGAFFSSTWDKRFHSSKMTVFMQTDIKEPMDLAYAVSEAAGDGVKWEQIDVPPGRRYAYSYVLGVVDFIWNADDGDMSVSRLMEFVRNGEGIKDFYSGILMPVFMALVAFIVILSVFGITRNVIRDKNEEFAILRSMGMESYSIVFYVLCDFLFTGIFCVLIGLAAGCFIHTGMIRFLNHTIEPELSYGFSCSVYVNSVTLNPFTYPAAVVLSCILLAVALSSVFLLKMTPVGMFQTVQQKKGKRKHGKYDRVYRQKGWKKLLRNKIDLHDGVIALVTIIVMGTALFGYTYFQAYSEMNNSELREEKRESGLLGLDYAAQKSGDIHMYTFNIENHHEYGMEPSLYEELKGKEFVKNSYAEIVNNSTRLVFGSKDLTQEQKEYLDVANLRLNADADDSDPFEVSLQKAENAMLNDIGYNDTELVYSLPAVGLDEDTLEKLGNNAVDGTVDMDKIRSGEEVLLATTKDQMKDLTGMFQAGDILPLSDIVLDEKEETYNFGYDNPKELAGTVYSEMVTTPEGEEVELSSSAFGKRKDIRTKVGALLVLDEEQAEKYMAPIPETYSYGMNVICLPETFGVWGLPDKNYTKIGMELAEGSSLEEADAYWYGLLSKTEGMSANSTAEIIIRMNSGTRKIMGIYYSMVILLVLTAMAAIAIKLYTNIRMKSQKFAVLRACGMTTPQIFYLVVRQNIIYPVTGIIFSIVPVALCEGLFLYIQKKVGSGEWSGTGINEIPWYHNVPFWYNLFQYDIVKSMAVIFAVCLVLLLLVTVPQILFIKNQSVVEEIEMSEF